MKKISKLQKIKEIQSHRDASHSEYSPYWDHASSKRTEYDSTFENPQANPDVLAETEIAAPSTPQLLLGEAIEHLQGRQKEVYLLTMREGKSLAETAEVLGIAKGSAQVFRKRAINFLTKYCEEAIKKGRI